MIKRGSSPATILAPLDCGTSSAAHAGMAINNDRADITIVSVIFLIVIFLS
jgi:hypothetical protein